jgi:hypothetical protein
MAKVREELGVCIPKALPRGMWVQAAQRAVELNPHNHAPVERLMRTLRDFRPTAERIAVVTKKYWHTHGVRLSVGFLDGESTALKTRILSHMNAWSKTANVKFVLGGKSSDVRIARMGGPDGGYWSYVGTDIQSIPMDEPTMNLEAFTMSTPESEFHRVVRHETGHTIGCPHEHMRRALVKLIDPKKAIAFFAKTQGWSANETRQQVLTPIEEGTLMGTPSPDPRSIMCYQIPGAITRDGKPIIGGTDIDTSDYAFMATIYPKGTAPKAPTRPAKRKAKRKGRR